MFTIKSLNNGQTAVYVKNDQGGRAFIRSLMDARERESWEPQLDHTKAIPALRIVPLSSGKIAIYFKNGTQAFNFVDALLKEVEPQIVGGEVAELYVV
ncbi:hypothetical protein [Paenibacillus sp. FSL L8-0708]|uniref:hypothetical protein n=1 Tax=Paenibacillus sp. FSL L8-0708 TaxID=2975311 RepID=UPI0030F51A12